MDELREELAYRRRLLAKMESDGSTEKDKLEKLNHESDSLDKLLTMSWPEYAQQKKNKKANDGAAGGENKPKRAPNAYNIFFKEQMAILKEKEAGMSKDECMTAKAKMAHVAELWKAKKDEHFEEAPEELVSEPESDKDEPAPEPVKVEPVKQEPKAKFTGAAKGNGNKFGGGGAKGGKNKDN